MINPDIKKRIREARENPVGFKCWDCGTVIEGLDINDKQYEVAPISIGGYKLLICERCCKIEE